MYWLYTLVLVLEVRFAMISNLHMKSELSIVKFGILSFDVTIRAGNANGANANEAWQGGRIDTKSQSLGVTRLLIRNFFQQLSGGWPMATEASP